jgi:hypothetical protein
MWSVDETVSVFGERSPSQKEQADEKKRSQSAYSLKKRGEKDHI